MNMVLKHILTIGLAITFSGCGQVDHTSPPITPQSETTERPPLYYHIFVRSFRDSDGDKNGDLRGIVESLDYLESLGVTQDLVDVEGLSPDMLLTLAEAGIKTRDDFADLAADELNSATDGILRDYDLSDEAANELIMRARAHWFEDDPGSEDDPVSGDDQAAEADSDKAAANDGEDDAQSVSADEES